MRYDVAVIGAGVVGATISYQLSQFDLRVCVLDRHAEPSEETSAANSGIVHAGYDAEAGSLKARFNVRGNEMMEDLCRDLDVPFSRIGSLVVGFNESDREKIVQLYQHGLQNGVPGMEILDRDTVHAMEPNLQDEVAMALYAPTAGIVCPYELTTASLEVACCNGVDYIREFDVADICPDGEGYTICAEGRELIQTRLVVNAAGLYSDRIAAMMGDTSFQIRPRKGQYILFEKVLGKYVHHVIFQTPKKQTKDVLVSPTVDGNLFIGPDAEFTDDREDVSTSEERLAYIVEHGEQAVRLVDLRLAITNFAGLRAGSDRGDFIVDHPVPGLYNAAGIDSPGLSSSPAIAEHLVSLILRDEDELPRKAYWQKKRKPVQRFAHMSTDERAAAIAVDPAFGRIVCRCETVSEAEVREAIRRPAGARTLDGVKRRARCGSGRCQGGFCSPRVMEILAEELQCGMEQINKFDSGSYVLLGKTRRAGKENRC